PASASKAVFLSEGEQYPQELTWTHLSMRQVLTRLKGEQIERQKTAQGKLRDRRELGFGSRSPAQTSLKSWAETQRKCTGYRGTRSNPIKAGSPGTFLPKSPLIFLDRN